MQRSYDQVYGPAAFTKRVILVCIFITALMLNGPDALMANEAVERLKREQLLGSHVPAYNIGSCRRYVSFCAIVKNAGWLAARASRNQS